MRSIYTINFSEKSAYNPTDDALDKDGACGSRLFEIEDDEFEPGKEIIFKLWIVNTSDLSDIRFYIGSEYLGRGQRFSGTDFTENIVFSRQPKQSLSYPTSNFITVRAASDIYIINSENIIEKIATTGGAIPSEYMNLIGNSCIGTKENIQILGAMKVKYRRITYNQWKWTPPNETANYLCMLKQADKLIQMFEIKIDSTIESGRFKDVTINVKDHITNTTLSGVSITIDGVYKGVTDGSGMLLVPQLETGNHTISMSKSGYVDSDKDELQNDEFTVT